MTAPFLQKTFVPEIPILQFIIVPFLVWWSLLTIWFLLGYKVVTSPSPNKPRLLFILSLILIFLLMVYVCLLVHTHIYIDHLQLFACICSIIPPIPDEAPDAEDVIEDITEGIVPMMSLFQWVILPLVVWLLFLIFLVFIGYKGISAQEPSSNDPSFHRSLFLAYLLICLVFLLLLLNIYTYVNMFLQINFLVGKLTPAGVLEVTV